MKTFQLFFIVWVLSITFVDAQIEYQQGYFISPNDEKTNCLIRNIDWKNSPSEFRYKIAGVEKTGTLENVKEFGVDGQSKYVRARVAMDRSSEEVKNLGTNPKPEFNEETLFLKVLIEGSLTLYEYTEKSLTRYFFRAPGTAIAQLVYKRYFVPEDLIASNNQFRQQLLRATKANPKLQTLKLLYRKKPLIKYFIKYHELENSEYVLLEPIKRKGSIHLSLQAGYTLNTLKLSTSSTFSTRKVPGVKSMPGFRVGLSLESLLPFNKNKWSIIIEPTLQRVRGQNEIVDRVGRDAGSSIIHTSLELPAGFRHYFHLKNDSKIFLDFFAIVDLPLNTAIDFERRIAFVDEGPLVALSAGMGYNFRSKFSIELRYNSRRNLLPYFRNFAADLSGYTLFFGYRLF